MQHELGMNEMEMNRGTASTSLEDLTQYPSLIVDQLLRGWFAELCIGHETKNEYNIHDPAAKAHIFTAKEDSSWLSRFCCGASRSFDMSVRTTDGELCRFERPYHCRRGGYGCCCCGDFFFQVIRVYGGEDSERPGELLGLVKEDYSFCSPTFRVVRADDSVAFTVLADLCRGYLWQLDIYDGSKDEHDEPVGSIKKMWGGLAKELYTDADTFAINFPSKAGGADRALLLGATFLLDFLFFENNHRKNNRTIVM